MLYVFYNFGLGWDHVRSGLFHVRSVSCGSIFTIAEPNAAATD